MLAIWRKFWTGCLVKKKENKKKETTLKLKHEKIYKCDTNRKNCTHLHSLPVKVLKVNDKDDILRSVEKGNIKRKWG